MGTKSILKTISPILPASACHGYCIEGCTGPGADSCFACHYSKDGANCVEECPTGKYNDNGECKICNENCKNGCKGPENTLGPNGCDGNDCKFKKDGTACVKSCPADTTYDKDGVCEPCHEDCKGCTGPDSKVGENGCSKCNKVKDDASGHCVKECPVSKYNEYGFCKPCHNTCEEGCKGPRSEDCDGCKQGLYEEAVSIEGCSESRSARNCKGECKTCHEECFLSCTGPNNTANDNGKGTGCDSCKNVKDESVCVTECPVTKYADVNKECKECHENCVGCNGPSNTLGSNGCKLCKDKKYGSLCLKECPANTYDVNGECKSK